MANPFEEAMQSTLKRVGTETDEDLVLYESLKPYHFRGLNRKYGETNVNRYIKIMEAKRAGIKRLGEN